MRTYFTFQHLIPPVLHWPVVLISTYCSILQRSQSESHGVMLRGAHIIYISCCEVSRFTAINFGPRPYIVLVLSLASVNTSTLICRSMKPDGHPQHEGR